MYLPICIYLTCIFRHVFSDLLFAVLALYSQNGILFTCFLICICLVRISELYDLISNSGFVFHIISDCTSPFEFSELHFRCVFYCLYFRLVFRDLHFLNCSAPCWYFLVWFIRFFFRVVFPSLYFPRCFSELYIPIGSGQFLFRFVVIRLVVPDLYFHIRSLWCWFHKSYFPF